jgi:hypothetical protein
VHGFLEAQHVLLTDVAAEHPRKRTVPARMGVPVAGER